MKKNAFQWDAYYRLQWPPLDVITRGSPSPFTEPPPLTETPPPDIDLPRRNMGLGTENPPEGTWDHTGKRHHTETPVDRQTGVKA